MTRFPGDLQRIGVGMLMPAPMFRIASDPCKGPPGSGSPWILRGAGMDLAYQNRHLFREFLIFHKSPPCPYIISVSPAPVAGGTRCGPIRSIRSIQVVSNGYNNIPTTIDSIVRSRQNPRKFPAFRPMTTGNHVYLTPDQTLTGTRARFLGAAAKCTDTFSTGWRP